MNSLLFFFLFPFLASMLILFFKNNKNLKLIALFFSIVPFVMLICGQINLDAFIDYLWFSPLNIHFYLKIDHLSLIFLYLTSVIVPFSILSINPKNFQKSHYLYSLIFLVQVCLMIFFMTHDLFTFTVFWEAMLLPLYFIISIWGKNDRQYSAFKFLLYMIAGSALMIVGVISIFLTTGSFKIDENIGMLIPHSKWILFVFLLAFTVKTPMFPFHAWLPGTYVNAPIPGTILLSALLSKAGIYGIIRIGFEIFPQEIKEFSPFLISLSVIGIFYGGIAAYNQCDFKRLIAYSSFSHVNFILLAIFIWNQDSHAGALLQTINHSITITALFLVLSWLEDRLKTTSMLDIGGLANYFPILCWLTLFFVLSSVALPGLNNFIGEFLILFGIFNFSPSLATIAGLSVILSVVYMLRLMQKTFFCRPCSCQKGWLDIGKKEVFISIPLIFLILWIGLYPKLFIEEITSVTNEKVAQ